jgi:hypothetical protein
VDDLEAEDRVMMAAVNQSAPSFGAMMVLVMVLMMVRWQWRSNTMICTPPFFYVLHQKERLNFGSMLRRQC